MEKIKVNLKNCYGIRAMEHVFDTSEGSVFLIYAPNGSMKSSFEKVFNDLSKGAKPKDVIFPNRETTFSVKDENNLSIAADCILAVEPYVDNYKSEKISTLMVAKELRIKYETLIQSIDEKVSIVKQIVSETAGLTRNMKIEDILKNINGLEDQGIYSTFQEMYHKIKNQTNPSISNISYAEIFNDKVLQFLSKDEIRKDLTEYIGRYNDLVDRSKYFRKGIFNHNNAGNVKKSLTDNLFFNAKHSITLVDRNDGKQEIITIQEFDSAIEEEKRTIIQDPKLSAIFERIDKEITKNVELRNFRTLLENHPEIIPELNDIEQFEMKLLLTYFFVAEKELEDFILTYDRAQKEIDCIIKAAKEQETKWRKVLSIFHSRFSVPFIIDVINQHDVILNDEAPSFVFKYKEGNDVCELGTKDLMNVLSTGEKRALYLLNVIFEIEARATLPRKSVLILDDIADSFDYKNKYAIVEYLKDIIDTQNFIMIVLTHNFDFFRTVQSRLSLRRKQNCLMAVKSNDLISLVQAEYLDPFSHWRKNIHKNERILMASIPMLRNLVEYTRGVEDPDYILLTSLLHLKPNTNEICMKDLSDVINRLLNIQIDIEDNKEAIVYKRILNETESCLSICDPINLENKVILAMGVRLLAEFFLCAKINDSEKVEAIYSNQTHKLVSIFKEEFPDEDKAIFILDRVSLMTPEAIHLNSFMYEPLIDMSDEQLKAIYGEVKNLIEQEKIEVF